MKLLSLGEVLFDIFENDALIGGAPLNLAAHAAIQGAKSYLLSAVGDDALGKKAISEVEKLSVKTDYIGVLDDKETGKCIVSLDEKGIPVYALLDDVAYDHIPFHDLSEEEFDVFAFGTLALRNKENRELVKKILENDFSHIYSDLNIRPPFYSEESILMCLENATIVKISDEELLVVTELIFGNVLEANEAISAIAKRFEQIKIIVLTCGAEGSLAWERESNRIYTVKAQKARVESTVGAGDSFGATFLVEFIKSGDIDSALIRASAVSAYVVSNKGAVPEGMSEFVKNLT